MNLGAFRTQPTCATPECKHVASHGISVVTDCCSNPVFTGKICDPCARRFTVQPIASNVRLCTRCGALGAPKVKSIERL